MQRQLAEIVAALDEDVESTELDLVIVLAGMQRVEIGDAIAPSTTASPSSTKRFCRTLRAASTIHGYRSVQL
jgi:hypothetical protein